MNQNYYRIHKNSRLVHLFTVFARRERKFKPKKQVNLSTLHCEAPLHEHQILIEAQNEQESDQYLHKCLHYQDGVLLVSHFLPSGVVRADCHEQDVEVGDDKPVAGGFKHHSLIILHFTLYSLPETIFFRIFVLLVFTILKQIALVPKKFFV